MMSSQYCCLCRISQPNKQTHILSFGKCTT